MEIHIILWVNVALLSLWDFAQHECMKLPFCWHPTLLHPQRRRTPWLSARNVRRSSWVLERGRERARLPGWEVLAPEDDVDDRDVACSMHSVSHRLQPIHHHTCQTSVKARRTLTGRAHCCRQLLSYRLARYYVTSLEQLIVVCQLLSTHNHTTDKTFSLCNDFPSELTDQWP